jgi:BirA family biotin operon repressor/biotin-[acetyl-CoA-carboxylase] ligase
MFRIQKLAVTPSTNDDAKAAARHGEGAGLVIWALRQTAGRGRRGRSWESPEGNLYASILLRPACDTRRAPLYGFAAALAVHDLVQGHAPRAAVTLKWPNDVLADGKKISGILPETEEANGRIDWLVLGIGLNVEHAPAGALYPVATLRAIGGNAELPQLLDELLAALARRTAVLEKEGAAALLAAWQAHAHKGPLSVRLPDDTALAGEFDGLDDCGGLILRTSDGSRRTINAGDAYFG